MTFNAIIWHGRQNNDRMPSLKQNKTENGNENETKQKRFNEQNNGCACALCAYGG